MDKDSKLIIGYVVGVFDLFHYGHENLILESIKRCDKIILAVHTDKFVESYKRKPNDNEILRKDNLLNFLKSLNLNIEFEVCIIDDNHIKLIDKYNINTIFHGTDWEIESYKKQIKYYEDKMDSKNIKIELIDYTKGISTSDILKNNIIDISDKKCFLFDLDNTLMLNKKPMKNAVKLVDTLLKNNIDIYLVTNNNRYSPKEIYDELNLNKLPFLYENIISSLLCVKDYLIENNYKNIYLWGTNSAKSYMESYGITCNSEINLSYDIIVLLYNNTFDYKDLSNLCTLLKNNNYIVGNIDPCYPDNELTLPDTGSIVKLLEYSCNKRPLKIFGKPNTDMLSSIKNKYKNEEIIFIGDSEITDKILALNCNIDFLRIHKNGDISDLGVLLYYFKNLLDK